jgi:hypothetical protein
MRTLKFDGTISSAFSQKLDRPLKFKGEYEAFGPEKDNYTDADWDAAIEEIRAKNEFPKNEDIVNYVNNKRLANARQQKMNEVLNENGIERPNLETSEKFRYDTMVKTLLASGMKEAEARTTASTILNYNPVPAGV